jgi:hypothetical protein
MIRSWRRRPASVGGIQTGNEEETHGSLSSSRLRRGLRWGEHVATIWVLATLWATGWPRLFARPDILPRVEGTALSAVAGRDYEVHLSLLNASTSATARVSLESPDTAVRFEPPSAEIRPRDRSIVVVRGRAANVGAQSLPIRVVSKAGLLHASHVGRVEFPLAIWPAERFGRWVVLTVQPGWAAFRATLELGAAAPKGLACRAAMADGDPADFTGAAPAVSYAPPGQPSSEPGGGARIHWSMAAVHAFQSVDVYVFAKVRPGAPDPEWAAVASRIRWGCERK